MKIEVGSTVYSIRKVSLDDNKAEEIAVPLKVTKVVSNSFTTEDGTRWLIGKYSGAGANSWTKFGSGDIWRAPRVFASADGRKEMTTAQIQAAMDARTAQHNAERIARIDKMVSEGVTRAILEVTESAGFGARRDLADIRQRVLGDAVLSEQALEYLTAIEGALIEAQRSRRDSAKNLTRLAELATGYAAQTTSKLYI